ncbi:MAG: YggT family protein [Chloroflexaceae bacterium]|nr:YggT family protein [Chloroflexaceae bacterium]
MAGFFITFINLLFQALWLAIFGVVILSWIDPTGNMRVTQILREITEPILGPIRKIMPSVGGFDFSPMVALLLLYALQNALLAALSTS